MDAVCNDTESTLPDNLPENEGQNSVPGHCDEATSAGHAPVSVKMCDLLFNRGGGSFKRKK